MSVFICIPTVPGREDLLGKVHRAYMDSLPLRLHKFIWHAKGYSTCGEAWNEGAKLARDMGFDYLHLTADDLVPHAGWYETAIETIVAGYLPCARVLNPDGSVQVQGGWHHEFPDWEETGGASVPFLRTQSWIDIPNIHYYSDNAYDYAQQYVNKWQFVARTNYAFTHYSAQSGRLGLTEAERQIYEEWAKSL